MDSIGDIVKQMYLYLFCTDFFLEKKKQAVGRNKRRILNLALLVIQVTYLEIWFGQFVKEKPQFYSLSHLYLM